MADPAEILDRLEEVCARQLDLAHGGQWDEVLACEAERQHLTDKLPAKMPEDMLPRMESLAGLTQALAAVIKDQQTHTGEELNKSARKSQSEYSSQRRLPSSSSYDALG